ncbi:MAG: AAA family ATPase [Meiothermus sp.]|nr:AAA family ATPase [Meiothermus sp.]
MDAENAAVLRLFGLPGLSVGNSLLRFPSKKGLALLMLVALEGTQSRDQLAAWLWPDSESPRDALRNCLAQVNKVLTAVGLQPLKANRQQISWGQPLEIDVLNLVGDGFEATVKELSGGWLEGFTLDEAHEFEAWAAERGAFYAGQLQQGLERLTDQALRSGLLEDALAFAQQRLRLDALNEGAYQSLMRVQRSAGREAEARETLLLCQTTLERELGLKPSAKTLGVLNEPLQVVRAAFDESLVGREVERGWLEQLCARKGLGLLYGEPGAGKSALLRSGLPHALWIECRPNDAALPFSSLLRGLRKRLRETPGLTSELPEWARLELSKLAPELHQAANPAEPLNILRLYAALNQIFPNAAALVLDDLQFMDAESAAWLWQAAQGRMDEAAAPTVLAYRGDEVNDAYKAALSRLSAQGASTQRVMPLGIGDLSSWLKKMGLPQNLAAEFLQLTGGNALFFKEASSAYGGSGSFGRGLIPLLQNRLSHLGTLEWRLAQFVAVAGAESSLTLAAQVLNTDQLRLAETWARLERLEVLRGNRFAHDLLRDAAMGLIPETLQEALSTGLLDALEGRLRRGENVAPAVLAEVALRAGDARREAHYRVQAGLETYPLGLTRIAQTHLERAILLLAAQPTLLNGPDLEALYLKLTPLIQTNLYSLPQLELRLEQLLGVARQRGSVRFETAVMALQADHAAQALHDYPKARALFAAALELAEGSGEAHAMALILERLSWFENTQAQTRLALEHARRALEFAEQQADLALHYRSLEAVYMFEQNLGRWAEAKAHALQAANLALQSPQTRVGRPYALTMAAFCALNLGDLQTAERHARTALELLEGSEFHNGLGFSQRTLALTLLERDDLSQALELALESTEHNRQIQNPFALMSSLATVARVHLAAARPKLALKALEEAQEALAKVSSIRIAGVAQSYLDNLSCAAHKALGGNVLPLVHRALEARRDLPETSSWILLVPRQLELEALWQNGEHELAEQELANFLQLYPDNPRVQLLHLRAQAALLRLKGEEAEARELLEVAHARALELGFTMQAREIQRSVFSQV